MVVVGRKILHVGVATPFITAYIVHSVWSHYLKRPEDAETIHVDILVGSDHYWDLVTGALQKTNNRNSLVQEGSTLGSPHSSHQKRDHYGRILVNLYFFKQQEPLHTIQTAHRPVMDTGSQRSYITNSAKSRLELIAAGEQRMTIMTFGSTQSGDCVCEYVKLGLKLKNGETQTSHFSPYLRSVNR